MKVFLILVPILFSLNVFADIQVAKDMKWLSTPVVIKINEDYCRNPSDAPLYICVGTAKGSNVEERALSCRTQSSVSCPDAQACYFQGVSGVNKEKFRLERDVKIDTPKPASASSSGGSK